MKFKKYKKQLKREIKAVKKQFARINYVSVALTLVLASAAVASTCGAAAGFV